MARREHHVVPSKSGKGWDVKINGAGHRTYHTRKKSTAIKKARAISRRHKTELVIHNSKGQIEVKNSHDTVRYHKPGPKPKKNKKKKVAKKVVKKKAKKVTKKKTYKKPVKKAKKVKRPVKRSAKKKAKKRRR